MGFRRAADNRVRSENRAELWRQAPAHYAQFTLHTDGRAEVEDTGEEAEFPRIAPAVTGRRNRYVYTLGVSSLGPSGWHLRRVVKRDLEAATSESFDYGPGLLAEEHVFVPRRVPRSEDDGWLVGAFLDYTSSHGHGTRGQSPLLHEQDGNFPLIVPLDLDVVDTLHLLAAGVQHTQRRLLTILGSNQEPMTERDGAGTRITPRKR